MPWCKISLKLRFLRSDRGYSGKNFTLLSKNNLPSFTVQLINRNQNLNSKVDFKGFLVVYFSIFFFKITKNIYIYVLFINYFYVVMVYNQYNQTMIGFKR